MVSANPVNIMQIKRCVANALQVYDLENIELDCRNRKLGGWIGFFIDDRGLEGAVTLQEESQDLRWILFILNSLSAFIRQALVSATLRTW
jgi:hypothetical protein